MFEALAGATAVDAGRSLVTAPDARRLGAGVRTFEGGHPLPNDESERAGRAALDLARGLAPSHELIVLLSGGASATLAVPWPPLSLADKVATTRAMLSAGLPIAAMNAVRKHLSAIKGGRLAASTPAHSLTLALSDVAGAQDDDPSTIGSGPTVPDPSTWHDAVSTLRASGVWDRCPAVVRELVDAGVAGRVAETPKPDPHWPARHACAVVGGRRDAMSAAAAEATRRGYRPIVHPDAVVGEARVAALAVAARLEGLGAGRWCVISSGETTVRVKGAGRGGRNQELALAAAASLSRLGRPVVLASVGTDGIDGPTDAAGAIVDGLTLQRARARGLDSVASLDDNDAYTFFDTLDDLLRPGPTGTNVGDLQVALVDGMPTGAAP